MLSPSMLLLGDFWRSVVWLVSLDDACIGLCSMLGRSLRAVGKVRLFVSVRKQGCRIESVPLKRLVLLSGFRKRRWDFEDGWLILEAF